MAPDKKKTSISLSDDLLEWIDGKIDENYFANRTHAIEYCIARIRDQEATYMPGSKN